MKATTALIFTRATLC